MRIQTIFNSAFNLCLDLADFLNFELLNFWTAPPKNRKLYKYMIYNILLLFLIFFRFVFAKFKVQKFKSPSFGVKPEKSSD